EIIQAPHQYSLNLLQDRYISTYPEVNDLCYSNITGIKEEPINCASHNSGFMKTMVEEGPVKDPFTCRDHPNHFCRNVKGIELCYQVDLDTILMGNMMDKKK
ncbi:hypothetical protein KI387_028577, partial [Taxus chinensis]